MGVTDHCSGALTHGPDSTSSEWCMPSPPRFRTRTHRAPASPPSGPAVDNILAWHHVGAATSWTWDGTGADLVDGTVYWATVQTRTGQHSGARVVLDASPPAVRDATLTVTDPSEQQVPVPHPPRSDPKQHSVSPGPRYNQQQQ